MSAVPVPSHSSPSASRIARRFAELRARGRKGLIPYIAAGDPSAALTVPLMHALAAAGADVDRGQEWVGVCGGRRRSLGRGSVGGD